MFLSRVAVDVHAGYIDTDSLMSAMERLGQPINEMQVLRREWGGSGPEEVRMRLIQAAFSTRSTMLCAHCKVIV